MTYLFGLSQNIDSALYTELKEEDYRKKNYQQKALSRCELR